MALRPIIIMAAAPPRRPVMRCPMARCRRMRSQPSWISCARRTDPARKLLRRGGIASERRRRPLGDRRLYRSHRPLHSGVRRGPRLARRRRHGPRPSGPDVPAAGWCAASPSTASVHRRAPGRAAVPGRTRRASAAAGISAERCEPHAFIGPRDAEAATASRPGKARRRTGAARARPSRNQARRSVSAAGAETAGREGAIGTADQAAATRADDGVIAGMTATKNAPVIDRGAIAFRTEQRGL
jgi:hypothetical protein